MLSALWAYDRNKNSWQLRTSFEFVILVMRTSNFIGPHWTHGCFLWWKSTGHYILKSCPHFTKEWFLKDFWPLSLCAPLNIGFSSTQNLMLNTDFEKESIKVLRWIHTLSIVMCYKQSFRVYQFFITFHIFVLFLYFFLLFLSFFFLILI